MILSDFNKLKVSTSPSKESGRALYENLRFLVICQEIPYFIATFVFPGHQTEQV